MTRTAGRIPLVLGMGNCTRSLTEEIRSTDLSGFSAILSVTPFYNKPSQEGLYLHYREVAMASPLPVVLYNVPGRTGINIKASTTLRLAKEFPGIIGIKEASGDFKQIEEIINHKPERFQVISGDDALTYPLISLGAEGVISVVGNAFPEEFGRMVRLCLAGRFNEALPIHYSFSRLYDELFVDGNPAGVKSLLNALRTHREPAPSPPSCRRASETGGGNPPPRHGSPQYLGPMIDKATVQKIKDTADIVEVVGDYVHLIRRGGNYMGLCPFQHNERTPFILREPPQEFLLLLLLQEGWFAGEFHHGERGTLIPRGSAAPGKALRHKGGGAGTHRRGAPPAVGARVHASLPTNGRCA